MAKRKLLIRRLTIHHNIKLRVAKDCKMCVRIFAEIERSMSTTKIFDLNVDEC